MNERMNQEDRNGCCVIAAAAAAAAAAKKSKEEDGGNESAVGEQVTALGASGIASLSRRRRSRHQGEMEQPTHYTLHATRRQPTATSRGRNWLTCERAWSPPPSDGTTTTRQMPSQINFFFSFHHHHQKKYASISLQGGK